MENNISNNTFGFQNNLQIKNSAGLNFTNKSKLNNLGYYAKKGEPMYMKEMDADDDGVITLDEFKEYCQANGISAKEMVRMLQLAASYRIRKANEDASKDSGKKSDKDAKEVESEAVYARRGDGKYDELMDTNNDDKVTYREYIEYCKENAKHQEKKSDTKIEEGENGEFITVDAGKAAEAYAKNDDFKPEITVESQA